jgi:hypothetical protein
LIKLIDEYTHDVSRETKSIGESEYIRVPHKWEFEQPEEFKMVTKKLHSLADKIVNTHQDLIRLAKNKLRV